MGFRGYPAIPKASGAEVFAPEVGFRKGELYDLEIWVDWRFIFSASILFQVVRSFGSTRGEELLTLNIRVGEQLFALQIAILERKSVGRGTLTSISLAHIRASSVNLLER